MTERITYKDAGVDVEGADRMIGSVSERIKRTFRSEVMGTFGGFAALFRPDLTAYERPVLVSTTDGVGTKLKIAFLTGKHDTVGIDLVAMNVNDLLVIGAEPLFFLDYFATGAIDPETFRAVIAGIARGCEEAGCSLIGGETAEMPDFYSPGEYDLAGFCVGLVDESRILDGSSAKPGDILLGLASSGLHSNGFSLVRKVLLQVKGYSVDSYFADLGKTLGEELLTPTSIYVKPIIKLVPELVPAAMAHITGGGFIGNIPRVLPDSLCVVVHKGSWQVPPIFDMIRREARLDDAEMFRTFNMGIGLVLILGKDRADIAVERLRSARLQSWVIGEVRSRLAGDEPITFV